MNIKVKICGIRTLEGALAAVNFGADFLGFNFIKTSKRYIKPDLALKIINKVRGGVKTVGVFQNEEFSIVNRIAEKLNLDFVQLHGLENNEYIQRMEKPVIRSFTENDSPERINSDYLLLDRIKQGRGSMADIQSAKRFAKQFSLFLAGGLNPSNVAFLVKQINPYGVDVAGGIETEGVQDADKIKEFIANAKKDVL